MKRRTLLLLAVLGLLTAACTTIPGGDASDDPAPQASCVPGAPDCDDTEVLGDGGAAGTCPVGTPDCNDTPGVGAPLPPDEAADCIAGTECNDTVDPGMGAPAGNGLTVTEALGGDVEGTIAVGGFIVANETGTFLCEALAESFPPQCGGASIAVEGLAIDEYPVEEEGSVRWTNDVVVLFGQVVDGTLVLDTMVEG